MSTQPDTAAASSGMNAAILGATGAVGKPLLQTLLETPRYAAVHAFLRRPSGVQHAKLHEHIVDFDVLLQQGNDGEEARKFHVGADDVYITLGTTRGQAGSAAAFTKIDRDFVVAGARAAFEESKREHSRVLYCSSQMANSSAPFLYPQSKGETEEALAAIGYKEAIIFRPGFLANADRGGKKRPIETAYGFFTRQASRFSDSMEIDTTRLARAMVQAAERGVAGLKADGVGADVQASFKFRNPATMKVDDASKRVQPVDTTVLDNAALLRMTKGA